MTNEELIQGMDVASMRSLRDALDAKLVDLGAAAQSAVEEAVDSYSELTECATSVQRALARDRLVKALIHFEDIYGYTPTITVPR